jgi:hypothetical protein
MTTPNQMKSKFQTVRSGISSTDKSYKVGYAVAVAVSWVGIALVVIGLIAAALWFFAVPRGLLTDLGIVGRIVAIAPLLSIALTGLGFVLFGQLARAIFDMSRSIQGQN